MSSDDKDDENVYGLARNHIQRVIDVALLISNVSQMASITKRQAHFQYGEFITLLVLLSVSVVFQVIAGVCFFISIEREQRKMPENKGLFYAACISVAIVLIINIFISSFDSAWTKT